VESIFCSFFFVYIINCFYRPKFNRDLLLYRYIIIHVLFFCFSLFIFSFFNYFFYFVSNQSLGNSKISLKIETNFKFPAVDIQTTLFWRQMSTWLPLLSILSAAALI